MRRGGGDCTVLSQVVFPLATSIRLVPRKVCIVIYRITHVKLTEKLGWAPSTFVSSRSDRAKARASRPEDFMDEEDLAEVRADQKLVSEHDEMDIVGATRSEQPGETEKESVTVRPDCVHC